MERYSRLLSHRDSGDHADGGCHQLDGLPFARRWVSGLKRSEKTLDGLVRAGVIHAYPVLVEEAGGMVSQAEHTLIVTEDGCEVTTR